MAWWKFLVQDKKKPGLEVKFKKGEHLPWRGIWFRVIEVKYDRIELEPVSTTWQFQKKLKKS